MGASESQESHTAESAATIDQRESPTAKILDPDHKDGLTKQETDLDEAWKKCCYCSKTKWGIGAVLSIDFEAPAPRISQIIKDTPADTKKLHIGDMITMIDDNDISGLSLQEVYKMLRGDQVRELVFITIPFQFFIIILRCCDFPVLRTLLSKSSAYEQTQRWGA